jgi:membrane-anchored mycosin MYCP
MPFHDNDDGSQSVIGEFVVAMRDLRYVLGKLERLGVRLPPETSEGVKPIERSDALDLALVRVAGVDQAAENLRPNLPPLPPGTAESATDTVIRAVRQPANGDTSRWVPVVGRNLAVTLHATPDIGFGGNGYPDPVDRAPIPPRRFGALDQERVRVGVVDTGMYSHPDLAGRWSHAGGRIIDPLEPCHPAGHGVFIAGIIAKRAPNCQLEVFGVLDEVYGRASVWEVAKAIAALAASCQVLNLSLSCFTHDDDPPFALRRAIERVGPDVVVVAAAGNHGHVAPGDVLSPTSQSWPAAFDRVVAVAAHDGGRVPPWSFQGPWVRLLAPGVDVTSCYLKGDVSIRYGGNDSGDPIKKFAGYASWSGSSFSAANVSGAIASLMDTEKMTAPEALHALEQRLPDNEGGIWAYQPS